MKMERNRLILSFSFLTISFWY